MFGFFKRKLQKPPVCGYCGEPRPFVHTGEAGADDLLKNSKLWRGDDTIVCLRCRSTIIGAPYNYQLDYSSASDAFEDESISTRERKDLAKTPSRITSEEDYVPGIGYHSGNEDDPYGDDGVQDYDPDAPYQPGDGYRSDEEVRLDNRTVGTSTTDLFGAFEGLPDPIRRMLPRLVFFLVIFLAITFWPEQKAEYESSPEYETPEILPGPPLQVAPIAGRATPAGNPGAWVLPGDYPAAALREERGGVVGFQLEISPAGEVTECNILESSGHADLDAASCRALMRRARFNPAQDATGQPTSSSFNNKVRWEIPQ